MNKLSILFLTLTLIVSSCSSGKKALEKGDYYESVIKSVNRLRQKPGHKKAAGSLRQAYPLALQQYTENIIVLKKSNDPYKWNKILDNMYTINRMGNEIKRCPSCLKVIKKPKIFIDELNEVKDYAAGEHYDAGMAALNAGTLESGRDAYYSFKNCNNIVPGYRDVAVKIEEARELGTLKVLLAQIPLPSLRFVLSAAFFQENVQAELNHFFDSKELIEMYLPYQVAKNKIKPNQIISIAFIDFSVGNVNHITKTYERISDDSVKVGEYNGNPVYNKVKANITSHHKEIISNGKVSLIIKDAETGKTLLNDIIPGEFVWVSNWGTFEGDKRALGSKELELCKQTEVSPPEKQDLFIEFTKPIFDQVINRIKGFYANY